MSPGRLPPSAGGAPADALEQPIDRARGVTPRGLGAACEPDDHRCLIERSHEHMRERVDRARLHDTVLDRSLQGTPHQSKAVAPAGTDVVRLWGRDDPFLDPGTADATSAHAGEAYRGVGLAGVGHWVPELAADRLSELILEQVAENTK